MSALRRLMNGIDLRLDRRSLRAPVASEDRQRGGGVPCLASQALERSAPIAQRLDPDARLKRIAAPRGAAADGAAVRWTFFFELPERRAKLLCDWYLDGDERVGRFGRECLDSRATPFPTPDSDAGLAVAQGRLGYARLATLWREERKKLPDLPLEFRDSDDALAELQRQGLRPDAMRFTLRTETLASGALVWTAQADAQLFQCRFG